MRNRRKLFFVLFFLSVLSAYKTTAQNNPYNEVSISSPNAASLGKYGDIPVNYHTGIPQIGLPLYNIKVGSLELPISLSYHASGLKVMEPASWVGAGWSLNAGGVITRTVQGTPDEKGTGVSSGQTKGYFSDYGYSNYIMVPSSTPGVNMEDWSGIANGSKDGEPDLFFYNFGSYSGKFYFRDDRTPIFVPEQDIKVEYNYSGSGSIQGFILTPPDGIQYYFGNTPGFSGVAPVEVTKSFTSQGLNNGAAISSWFLNKIASADGQFAINLMYQTENYSYYTTSMFPVDGNSSDNEYNLVKNVLQGVKLKQISFPNGNINFSTGAVRTDLSDNALILNDNVNTEARSLDTIKISDNGNFCKSYVLSFSYFIDAATSLTGFYSTYNFLQTDRKRLRLDSLKEVSCDGALVIPAYKFEYYAGVPRRLTFAQDHWGFYNGAVANSKLVPTYTVNSFTTVSGANRDASWPQMNAGTLNKITYPTGGSSTFNFEANTIWTTFTENLFSQVSSITIGFTGVNPLNVTNPVTISGTIYELGLINSPGGNTAVLTLFNSIGTNMGTVSATPGTNNSIVISNLSPGSYQLSLSKNCDNGSGSSGGIGANGTLSIFAPETTSQNTTVGGLRIKTITNNDNLSALNNIVTTYSYNNSSGESNGILFSKPVYVQVVRNDLIKNIGNWSPSSGFTPSCSINGCTACDGGNVSYFKSPNSIRPMGTTQGNHIGYNSVKVSQTGNGYSIYQYYTSDGSSPWGSNQGDFLVRNVNIQACDENAPNFPPTPLPFDFKRGELSYEAHYNEAAQLLKEVNYFPVFGDVPMSTPAIIIAPFQSQTLGTKYYLTTSKKTELKVVENTYSPGIGFVSTTNISYFESPYHHQVARKLTINSTGDTLETRIRYTADFRISACDNIADGSQQFYSDSIACLNQYNTARSGCGSSSTCLTNSYLNYLQCLINARVNYVNSRKTNFTNIVPLNLFQTNHNTAKAAANVELSPILVLQDQNSIAVIELSNWKKNKLTGSVFNRFDYSTNPANRVYPNKTLAISLLAGSSTFTNATVNAGGTSIVKDSRYKDEASHKFLLGNQAEITSKNGITTSYLWDYFNAFPVAQVTGAANNQIAYTSFESNNTGNLTYATAKTADISSPTGSFCYNLTSGAIQRSLLSSASSYILSYWYKTGATVSVSAGTQSNAISGVAKNGWVYKQLQFTGTTAANLTGNGLIDEVRIYPVGAQMTTYTYSPLAGITSSNDVNNKITYYQYDNLNRLKNIKDQDRNITRNFFYNYGLALASPPALLSFKASNSTSIVYSAQLTSKTTGQVFNLTISTGSNITIGNIPPDVYDVLIDDVDPLGNLRVLFRLCTFMSSGSSATFYNVSVSAGACNSIIIN